MYHMGAALTVEAPVGAATVVSSHQGNQTQGYGRLDVAFNNASTLGEAGPTIGVSEAGWSATLAINRTGNGAYMRGPDQGRFYMSLHSDTLIYPSILALSGKMWIKNDRFKLQAVYFGAVFMTDFYAMLAFSYY